MRTAASVSTDRWTCPRCQRTTIINALSQADIDVALDAVRTRHGTGHAAGDRIFDVDGNGSAASSRANARARRADSRAAARRRANRKSA